MSARKKSGSGVPPLSPEVGRVAPNAPWPVVQIGSALNLINGRAFKPSEWSDSGLPIVRIQNLNNPEAPFNFYDGELPAKFRLKDDDLLFAWSGTPGTSFGAHIWRGGDAWLNQHIFKVEFDENQFDRRFLRLAINQNLNDYIRAAHGGAGLAHITKGKFEASEILCPPLPEQRRVVAEIETQWAKLDAGVTALKRVQANLKRYRAAVLKAACEGCIIDARTTLSELRPLGELVSLVTKGSSPNWQGFEYCDAGIVFVRSQNVGWGNLNLNDVARLPAAFNAKEKKSVIRTGDVLLNIVGASIGRAAVASPEIDGGNVNQAVAVIRPRLDLLDPQFLKIYLLSDRAQSLIHSQKVDVARANFSLEQIRNIPVPLPPLAEQTRIVAEVERRLSVIDQLETLVATNLARATRLRQAVLQQAFGGNP